MSVFVTAHRLTCLGDQLYTSFHTLKVAGEAGQFQGLIPGADDLAVTHELCHWWLRDWAAPADDVHKVFSLLVQAKDTEHQQLTRFTFPRRQDLSNSLVPHCAVAICQHSCYNILTVPEVYVSLHDFSGYNSQPLIVAAASEAA